MRGATRRASSAERTPPARIPPSADSYGFGAVVACRAMRHRRGKARPDRAPAPDRCADRARVLERRGRRASGISPRTAKAHCDVLRQKLGVPRRRQIPAAFKALTGEDPMIGSASGTWPEFVRKKAGIEFMLNSRFPIGGTEIRRG